MFEAAKYSAIEQLRNGHWVEFRALRPDEDAISVGEVGQAGRPADAASHGQCCGIGSTSRQWPRQL